MILNEVIPSHRVAAWLLSTIDTLLNALGLYKFHTLETALYIVIVLTLAVLLGWLVKKAILLIVKRLVRLNNTDTGRELLRQRVFTKCGRVITPLVFLSLVPYAFVTHSSFLTIIERIAVVYLLITIAMGLSAILRFVFYRYDARENTRNLPLKGILNVAQGIVWAVVAIVAVSVIIHRSPAVLLTGLGAFAAALMLIFKDSILGFVAGVQMSQNDMLHVGDWIVVPGTPANGIVTDVSLTAVKVRNFDNTIVTVPPYTLVSTSFQNYVGMSQAKRRRFTSTLTIVTDSVQPCTPELISSVSAKYEAVGAFADRLKAANEMVQNQGGLTPVSGTVETNLGLFRAYAYMYLENNPNISHDDNILVRLLEPTPEGLTLQIYAFASTTEWATFESISSAVMEHMNVAVRDFGLRIYSRADITVQSGQQSV